MCRRLAISYCICVDSLTLCLFFPPPLQSVRAHAGPKCAPFFTASVFAKLQSGDARGRLSVMALFNYVMRKVWLQQTRIGDKDNYKHTFPEILGISYFLRG